MIFCYIYLPVARGFNSGASDKSTDCSTASFISLTWLTLSALFCVFLQLPLQLQQRCFISPFITTKHIEIVLK